MAKTQHACLFVACLALMGCGSADTITPDTPPPDGDTDMSDVVATDGDTQEQDQDTERNADSESLEMDADSEADSDGPETETRMCLSRTQNSAECKDCCDCSGAACQDIVACRNACPTHDFSQNTDFISVNVSSSLGPSGNYSACTALATQQACKACCDCDHLFQCGDQKYCRNACATISAYPPLVFSEIGIPLRIAPTQALQFAEGPLWDTTSQTWLFSDITADTIYRMTPPATLAIFRSPSQQANGLGFDAEGLLLAAEHASHAITRRLADGTQRTLADSWEGQRLNSPNDLIVRADGTIYFTDPTFGLGSATSELGFTGLYRLDASGVLHLEAKLEGQPNGVAFAPGETTLYVAATSANQILAFTVAADGALSGQRVFADVEAPDGFAVDQGGNLYVAGLQAGQGALIVLSSKGETLGSIALAEHPTNAGFGGADGKTLLVTARTALYSIVVPIPGL